MPPTLSWILVSILIATPPSTIPFPFSTEQAQILQRDWARYLKQAVETKNDISMSLILIPPGEFVMGSTPKQAEAVAPWVKDLAERTWEAEFRRLGKEELPPHRVHITRPFHIGKTEVTIGQYRQFVEATQYVSETERFGGGNSSKKDEADPKKKGTTWKAPGYKVTDASPVTQLTRADAFAFCNWLSEKEGRKPCYRPAAGDNWEWLKDADGYRLPTEAEWEYACRAGTATQFSFGDPPAELDKHAWYNRNADATGAGPVATKLANAWGLHDMHGNAWERCQDYYAADWYSRSPSKDPSGPESGSNHIVRGGGWHYFHLHCRSAYRNNYSPVGRTGNTGFRVVRPIGANGK